MKDLADVHFANAKTIVLLQDNLNIHSKARRCLLFGALAVAAALLKWTKTTSTMVENGLMIMRTAKATTTNGKALTTNECVTTGRDWKAITKVNR